MPRLSRPRKSSSLAIAAISAGVASIVPLTASLISSNLSSRDSGRWSFGSFMRSSARGGNSWENERSRLDCRIRLGLKAPDASPNIVREAQSCSLGRPLIERKGVGDGACELCFAAGEGPFIRLEQGGARGSERPHGLRHAKVAHAKLAKHRLHVVLETVGKLLRLEERFPAFGFEPVEHDEKVERQHDEAAFERVGHAVTPVEDGKPRLRHNRAIEFLRGFLFAPPGQYGAW